VTPIEQGLQNSAYLSLELAARRREHWWAAMKRQNKPIPVAQRGREEDPDAVDCRAWRCGRGARVAQRELE